MALNVLEIKYNSNKTKTWSLSASWNILKPVIADKLYSEMCSLHCFGGKHGSSFGQKVA